MPRGKFKLPGWYRIQRGTDETSVIVPCTVFVHEAWHNSNSTIDIEYTDGEPGKDTGPFIPRRTSVAKMRRISPRDQLRCTCSAYDFPHKAGAGKCLGQLFREKVSEGVTHPLCWGCDHHFVDSDHGGRYDECDIRPFNTWARLCPIVN